MPKNNWINIGSAKDFKAGEVREVLVGKTKIAIINKNGAFTAVSGECNHEKGPLGKGRLEGDYVVCPWHGWRFHREHGHGHPPFEAACLPRYQVKAEKGTLYLNPTALNKREHFPHPPHPLAREVKREPGPLRIAGISTTAMDTTLRPRYSTSEDLLSVALAHAKKSLGAETQMIKLRDLKFQHCGGFYSIDEHACTWPCTNSQMDANDELGPVYEALVFWADVVLVATPIRWGNASSLYYKMAERLNCIQNQTLIADTTLINNKVAAFIITGGQDNVQAVAGQMLMFFAELGFVFPQYPFVAHSRGWSAEDMENNTKYVQASTSLRSDVKALTERAVNMAEAFVKNPVEVSP